MVKLGLPSTSLPVVDELTAKTPYLAPEILNKQRPRQTSDIYSIGVILWEMLNGRRAYLRADLETLGISQFVRQVTDGSLLPWMSLATEPAHPETVMGPVAALWDALVLKCLSSLERGRPQIGEVKEGFRSMMEQAATLGSKAFEEQVTGMFMVTCLNPSIMFLLV